MSEFTDDATLPLSHLMVVEAWRVYVGSEASPSVPNFVDWLGTHEPLVLRLVKERQVSIIAAQLLRQP